MLNQANQLITDEIVDTTEQYYLNKKQADLEKKAKKDSTPDGELEDKESGSHDDTLENFEQVKLLNNKMPSFEKMQGMIAQAQNINDQIQRKNQANLQ